MRALVQSFRSVFIYTIIGLLIKVEGELNLLIKKFSPDVTNFLIEICIRRRRIYKNKKNI